MARIVRIHEYGDASVLKLEDLDVPAPAATEVQICVKAIGLNRAEVMFRNHAYLQEAEFPSRLGYEAAGIVVAVGSDVTETKVGDAVALIPPLDIARWGTYGELATGAQSLPLGHCGPAPCATAWQSGTPVHGCRHSPWRARPQTSP